MNELIPLENPTPATLFVPGGMDDLLARIEEDARALVPDVSTRRGREAIASNAMRVTRSRTYLDKLRIDYVRELKRLPGEADQVGRQARIRLDALRAEVRKPLTDWEDAEKARQDEISARLAILRVTPHEGMPSTFYATCIAETEATVIDEAAFGDLIVEADTAREATLYRLGKLHHAALAREQAEIDAQVHAEQERIAREERIAQEAAHKATREAEARAEALRRHVEQERAEAAARAVAEQERAERARQDAEKARAESDARAERMRIEQERATAEHARHMEEARMEMRGHMSGHARYMDEAQRQQEIATERAVLDAWRGGEEEKALANRAATWKAGGSEHRARIHREAVEGLVAVGLSAEQARQVVVAVVRGQVPHVRIEY